MSETAEDDLVSTEVQGCIKKLLKDRSIQNYNMVISPGAIRGDNYLGVVAKVEVKGEDKNGKDTLLNLIVKSAPQQEAFRTFAPIRLAYDREVYVYSKILPEFTKLQKERGILQPFKSFAKFYMGTMGNLHEAIIMENMKELGYKLSDRRKPLDYNHVLLVVKEYGKLHALSYALRDQKPEVFKELCENTQETFFNNMSVTESFLKNLKEWGDRALNALDPIEDKVAWEKLKVFREKMFYVAQNAVQSEPAGKYAVIGHGDSWMNNMLFKYANSAKPNVPTDLCFLDWQLSRVGSPALDWAYFIFTCTDKELRDQHYDNLLQEYYTSLSTLLRELGSDPEKLLPFEVFQQHLKKFCAYGLYMAIVLLYLMAGESEEIPDVHNVSNEDEVMEKFNFEIKNLDGYNKRIRGVILDFVKFGYEF